MLSCLWMQCGEVGCLKRKRNQQSLQLLLVHAFILVICLCWWNGEKKDGGCVGVFMQEFSSVVPMITTTKERIDEVDDEKKVVSYSVIEGDLLNFFKTFKAKVRVAPKGEGDGSLVTWSCDYEKASEEVPALPEHLKDFAVKTFHGLDAYLLKAAA